MALLIVKVADPWINGAIHVYCTPVRPSRKAPFWSVPLLF